MKDLFSFSKIAYKLGGIRLFYLTSLMAISVLLEGLGVSLFLPLLMGIDSDNEFNQILSSLFKAVGLDYTFRSILLFMVAFFLLRSGFLVLQGSCVARILADSLINLRGKLVRRIFEADYQYLVKKNIGYLNNALVREFEAVTLAFKMYARILIKFIFVLMYTALPLALNFTLTAIILSIGLPTYFVVKKINRLTKNYSIDLSAHSAGLQGLMIQALGYLKYLKATHTYGSVLRKIDRENETLGNILYRTKVLQNITEYAFEPLAVLALAALLFYQVEILGKEVLEVAFLVYLLRRAISGILSVQQSFRKFLGSIGSVNVFKTLDRELAENYEDLGGQTLPPDFSLPIHFDQTSFGYDPDRPILKDLTFSIPPKSMVAFVGDSGAGKSTLVNLLTGLLKATGGEIRIGDKSYERLDQKALRKEIGYITQESVIFNDSIRNNMTLWDDRVQDETLYQASEKAHIRTFIEDLPERYDTLLGEGGMNISGGQRQRIMIARELCKQSSLLIFDEATSALDTHSEQEIQKNINEFRGQKTIVLIAHRLSTIKNSDLIFVLKNGQIVEHGTYDQLYLQNGEFRNMVDRQMMNPSQEAINSL